MIYDNNLLNKENVLRKISQESIYQHYFYTTIQTKKHLYTNPFRTDRHVGSCLFKYKGNTLQFIDYAVNQRLDCFGYVMNTYQTDFYGALCIINRDFKLNLVESYNRTINYKSPDRPILVPKIEVKTKDNPDVHYKVYKAQWTESLLQYWYEYGITLNTLLKYEVYPVAKYYTSYGTNRWYKKYDNKEQEDPCFVYLFKSDKVRVKLYRPFYKEDKWNTNCKPDIVQGYKQLPPSGDLLIISSSLKDLMCIVEAGIPSIAPQAESVFIPEKLLARLRNRFKTIIICFDNDSTGIKQSSHFSKLYNLNSIVLPSIGGCKDAADIAKKYGITILRDIILQRTNWCQKSKD